MMIRSIIVALLLLALGAESFAQERLMEKARNGQLVLSAGTLYVPNQLDWKHERSDNGRRFVGSRGAKPVLFVAELNSKSELLSGKALELFKSEAAESLSLELSSLEQLDARIAPYPWPETQELSLKVDPYESPITVYLGSGSEKTLIICAVGERAEATANRVAASFKENFQAKRKSQARHGSSDHIHSMLGTGTTFFLLFTSILPVGLTLFVNRRRKERNNPYQYSFRGLVAGIVVCLIFNYVLLSRFSWAEFSDYVQVFGGSLVRGLFLAVAITFLSRRWSFKPDDE